jgi:galactokinase
MPIAAIAADFHRRFGHEPLLVRAPGRINLIGEHTDYNDGLVLPAAIDKEIFFAVGLNGGDTVRLASFDKADTYEVAVTDVAPSDHLWANYLLGVVAQFQKHGVVVPGFDCVFGGNVPIGAGMSSSAAIECGLAFALNELLHTGFDRMALAKMGQQAEHTYAHVMSGLMDQFASLYGRAGHVVRLDCRSLEYEYFPFAADQYHLVLCNSGVKHSLASSEYNKRRQECAQGVAVLQKKYPEIKSLRDATLAQVEADRDALGDVVYRRCRYVVQENQRVQQTCDALKANDMEAVGRAMYASHAGLRDDYQVSCLELDELVEMARPLPGVLGARMMGGGFGGCTINLVAVAEVEGFVAAMEKAFEQRFQQQLETYHTVIVGGVSELHSAAVQA